MQPLLKFRRFLALAALCLLASPLTAEEPRSIDADRPEVAQEFFARSEKKVLTFLGYSSTGYEDPEAMLAAAKEVLAKHDPQKTIVNIGATADGIGAVYELARSLGFETTGIVSSLAKEENATLSSHVQTVIYVKDKTWGGLLEGTGRLSPTSEAVVACSDQLFAIGGGAVARDELLAAKRLGKKFDYLPADLNHQLAVEKARKQNRPAPTNFRGAADEVFGKR